MKKIASLYFVVTPLILSLGIVVIWMSGLEPAGLYGLVVYGLGAVVAGFLFSKRESELPFPKLAFPALLSIGLGTILMLISKGFLGSGVWAIYVFLFFPFLANSFFTFLSGEHFAGLLAPLVYYFLFLVPYLVRNWKNLNTKRAVLPSLAGIVLCGAVVGFIHWQRIQNVLPSYGFEYENGYSSVDLFPYHVDNPNNKLPKLEEPSTFRIENANDMPILDGAEAAFPVYSAFANEVYKDIETNNVNQARQSGIVSFTNTIYAFERLVSGEVDIFFGAQPSKKQQELADRFDKELVLTPIGKEAFVFFVNRNNPVNNLTSSQIKDIYSGKIQNWSMAGGRDDRIRAFQRPEDSGSQTIMQVMMGDTPLIDPLKEEVMGMGDLVEQVANYRNYKNSIGYSFRFFATGMYPNDDIKLLSVDGIEPSEENIRSGKYPYVVNLYAVTVKHNPNKNVQPFLEWMQGPQGQKLVGEIGYVTLQ